MISRSIIIVLLCAPVAVAQNGEPGPYTPLTSVQRGLGGDTGVLHTSFRAGQIFSTNSGGGFPHSSNLRSTESISLDADYSGGTQRSSFRLQYQGGALLTNQRNYGTSFQRFDTSGSYQLQRVNFVVGDTFQYAPETYSVGGTIPGVGNLGSQFGYGVLNPTLLGNGNNGNLLLNGTTTLSNATFGEADFSVNARATLTSSGSYGFQHFPDFSRFNSHQLVFAEGFDYRFTGRTSAALSYDRSHFYYDSIAQTTTVDLANVSVSHVFTRTISVQGSIGPQWIHVTGITNRQNIGVNAMAHYTRDRNDLTLRYSRRASSGSIALFGAQENLLNLSFNRPLSRNWKFSSDASYIRSSALLGLQKFNTIQVGAQVNRSFNQRASLYLTYDYRRQSVSNALRLFFPVLNNDVHTVGMGLTFTPRGIRLRR